MNSFFIFMPLKYKKILKSRKFLLEFFYFFYCPRTSDFLLLEAESLSYLFSAL